LITYRERLPLHSHSIVQNHDNALNFRRKFFPRTTKHRLLDPSENRALDFKGEFRRSVLCSVSATIGIDRSIFLKLIENAINARQWKNTVSCCDHQCERPTQTAVDTSTIGTPSPRATLGARM
jgi:hypothetical protein